MTPLDLNCRPSLARGVRLQIDAVTGEAVLLYPEGVLVLNETAHEIAGRCDDKTTLAEIVAALAAEYEADENVLLADATLCLTDLRDRHLVVLGP